MAYVVARHSKLFKSAACIRIGIVETCDEKHQRIDLALAHLIAHKSGVIEGVAHSVGYLKASANSSVACQERNRLGFADSVLCQKRGCTCLFIVRHCANDVLCT